MKVYTKTGDLGKTSLIGGSRVPKYDIRIESYGTVDELCAWIGLIRDQDISNNIAICLTTIQNHLFVIESMLACDTSPSELNIPEIKKEDVEFLEHEIDIINSELPELKSFVLPGGDTVVSYCHIARTVCRRAERIIIQLNESYLVNPNIIAYVNRLSDYLFVLSRKISKDKNAKEYVWNSK